VLGFSSHHEAVCSRNRHGLGACPNRTGRRHYWQWGASRQGGNSRCCYADPAQDIDDDDPDDAPVIIKGEPFRKTLSVNSGNGGYFVDTSTVLKRALPGLLKPDLT
jgi:hypothetical protein